MLLLLALVEPALEQDKARFFSDPASRLLSLQDKPIDASKATGASLPQIDGLDQDFDTLLVQQLNPGRPIGMLSASQEDPA